MARELLKFDPFFGLDTLSRELFDGGLGRALRSYMPATDVYLDGDKSLVVESHLPTFEEGDVSITVDRGALVIQAERHEKQEDAERKYVMRESSSSFYRSIPLPEQAQEDAIAAEFQNGVLKVTVPLTAPPAPRKIAIASDK